MILMQIEQRTKDIKIDTDRSQGRDEEVAGASLSDNADGILESPLSRMDGETPFGNVEDTYLQPGGEEGDEDYDDEDDDTEALIGDDVDDDDDDLDKVVTTDADDVTDADLDETDLEDDDLLLDEDDDDEEDDDIV
jgi:hypothetical protein